MVSKRKLVAAGLRLTASFVVKGLRAGRCGLRTDRKSEPRRVSKRNRASAIRAAVGEVKHTAKTGGAKNGENGENTALLRSKTGVYGENDRENSFEHPWGSALYVRAERA